MLKLKISEKNPQTWNRLPQKHKTEKRSRNSEIYKKSRVIQDYIYMHIQRIEGYDLKPCSGRNPNVDGVLGGSILMKQEIHGVMQQRFPLPRRNTIISLCNSITKTEFFVLCGVLLWRQLLKPHKVKFYYFYFPFGIIVILTCFPPIITKITANLIIANVTLSNIVLCFQ